MPGKGLVIRGQRGHPEVRAALIRYAKWFRKTHEFPMKVPVYLYPSETIKMQNGEWVSASFFGPFDKNVSPYIRIATGDYPELKKERGRDSALAAFIVSLSHEIVHYYQWINHGVISERGVTQKANAMLRRYNLEVDHP